jgi:hypothetical protein
VTTNTDQQLLTFDQAAVQLGISSEAVRLRLRRGKLRGERVDGQWRVCVDQQAEYPDQPHRPTAAPDQQTNNGRRPRRTGSPDRDALAQLTARVAELETERTWLRTRLEAEAQERAELRRLLGNMQAQLMALLPAPQDLPATAPESDENGREHGNGEILPSSRRPWWRFWQVA